MELCCYGCGQEGKFKLSERTLKTRGRGSCSEHYRQCPVKRKEWAAIKSTLPVSDETRKKIGEKSKGRPGIFKGKTHLDDPRIIHGENHSHFGKIFSVEHRAKISQSRSGIPLSIERRQQISQQMSGRSNPRFGKPWSEGQYEKWLKTINERGTLRGENNPNFNPCLDREKLSTYRQEVYRISKKNWTAAHGKYVSGRKANGFELDHIVPVSVCFEHGVAPVVASHLLNLQLLPWQENAAKHTKFNIEHLQYLLEQTRALTTKHEK